MAGPSRALLFFSDEAELADPVSREPEIEDEIFYPVVLDAIREVLLEESHGEEGG